MNKIVNNFNQQEINLCLKCIKGSLDLTTVLAEHLLKTNKKIKNPRPIKIYLSKRTTKNLYGYYMAYVIKDLILLKIRNMMGMKEALLQWSINILIKNLQVVLLKKKLCRTKNQLNNYTHQLLENLKNEKYTHLLQIIFGC